MKLWQFLQSTASRVAESVTSIGQEETALKDKDPTVTRTRGKRNRPLNHIIAYRKEGPLHRQIGSRWLHGEEWPIMQTYFKHKFLHATKGWREYTGGALMRIPFPPANTPRRLAFYGRH